MPSKMLTYTRQFHFPLMLAASLWACADPQSTPADSQDLVPSLNVPDVSASPARPYPQDDVILPDREEDDASVSVESEPDSDTIDAEPSADGESEEDTEGVNEDATGDGSAPAAAPERTCAHTFTYTPDLPFETLHLAVSYLDWANGALAMTQLEGGGFSLTLDLSEVAPGSYGYKFIANLGMESELWLLDSSNKMKRFDDGVVNSKLLVPDCRAPLLKVTQRDIGEQGTRADIQVSVEQGVDTPLDPESLTLTHNFLPISGNWEPSTGTWSVSLEDLPPGKHTLRFDASGQGEGLQATPVQVSFWAEQTPFAWQDALLYFAFTDRFRDEDPSTTPDSCLPEAGISNWLGGDWKGVTAAIEEGYFESLGINTLWLNAPMDNPEGCLSGLYERTYTAFHAYFPLDLFATEERFGTMEDLRNLVSAAHTRGMRVLVDLPANHLFESAPELTNQPSDWFNDDGVCRELGWVTPETCWFEPYLPDLNYRNDVVVEYMSEVALWWILEADLDGFRVDAVKHMHPHFLHTLRAKIDQQIEAHSDQLFWTIGETFTGGWQEGGGSEAELVKAYISDDQLYGQFDFPLYWPLREAFATRSAPLTWLAQAALGAKDYYGEQAIMSSFLGNHDVTRFISAANGDNLASCEGGSTVVAWDCPPAQPSESQAYARLLEAFTFLTSYTAVPLIYYGDEIGLAGAGDPDNRRMMPWDELNAHQVDLREKVSALFLARKNNRALRRGAFNILSAGERTLVIERYEGQSVAYAVFNQSNEALEISVSLDDALTLTNALDGSVMESSEGELTWSAPAGSVALWTSSH